MSLIESLIKIQQQLTAPKNLWNKFGKYNYRSTESILQAVKPLLLAERVALVLSDEIRLVGDQYYIYSVATLYASDGEQMSVSAYAREAREKKGMDDAQITGATSSYARKYALNGLFCIDDTKDVDADEYHANAAAEVQKSILSKLQPKHLKQLVKCGSSKKDVDADEYHANAAAEVHNRLSKQIDCALCKEDLETVAKTITVQKSILSTLQLKHLKETYAKKVKQLTEQGDDDGKIL
jgi:hypothetical protein